MKWRHVVTVAAITCGFAMTAESQDLPSGKWWRRPEIVKEIALSDEQQRRLDAISRTAVDEMIDARAEVNKASFALRDALDQPAVSRESVQQAGARLSDARSRLFARELTMLVDMRGVLDAKQWTRLRAEMERRQSMAPRATESPRAPRPTRMPRRPGMGPMNPPPTHAPTPAPQPPGLMH